MCKMSESRELELHPFGGGVGGGGGGGEIKIEKTTTIAETSNKSREDREDTRDRSFFRFFGRVPLNEVCRRCIALVSPFFVFFNL